MFSVVCAISLEHTFTRIQILFNTHNFREYDYNEIVFILVVTCLDLRVVFNVKSLN